MSSLFVYIWNFGSRVTNSIPFVSIFSISWSWMVHWCHLTRQPEHLSSHSINLDQLASISISLKVVFCRMSRYCVRWLCSFACLLLCVVLWIERRVREQTVGAYNREYPTLLLYFVGNNCSTKIVIVGKSTQQEDHEIVTVVAQDENNHQFTYYFHLSDIAQTSHFLVDCCILCPLIKVT